MDTRLPTGLNTELPSGVNKTLAPVYTVPNRLENYMRNDPYQPS